ncbi:MAG: MFS transporter [Acidobacteria bacterium]|nr:MFS transporter [Acidobacteriota bacterium]
MPVNLLRHRLHPTVLATGWTSFLNDVSSEMIYPLLPVFLTRTLGASMTFVGLVEGVAETAASLVKLISGRLSDRLGHRRHFILGGYALSSLTRPLLGVATAPGQVLALRLVDRLGKGTRGSARDALTADLTDPAHRGLAFGFQRGMDNAGAILGPLLASGLLLFFGMDYRTLFLLASIPGAVAVFVVWRYVHDASTVASPPEGSTTGSGTTPGPKGGFDRRVIGLLITFGLFALGNSSDAFLILRARDLGVADAALPALWIVLSLSKTIWSVPGGVISDRLGRGGTILTGWAVYAMVYAGFAVASSAWHAWGLFAAYGLFFGLTEGAERALMADLSPAEARGTVFGAYNFTIGMAALPSSLLMGAVWQRFGYHAAFMLGAGLALSSAVLLFLILPRSRNTHHEA